RRRLRVGHDDRACASTQARDADLDLRGRRRHVRPRADRHLSAGRHASSLSRVLSAAADIYRRTRKPNDILWNRFVARPLAAVLVVPLARTPITPNQVTF